MVSAVIYEGDVGLEVVGESFYQAELTAIAAARGREVVALLVPDPNNAHDSNAIEVRVEGIKVGHLSRDDATEYQSALIQLMRTTGKHVALNGRIVGGEAERPTLGIWLRHTRSDFGLPDRPRANGVRTGKTSATSGFNGPRDHVSAIRGIRQELQTESRPIKRHFLFNDLEESLYKSRDAFTSALNDFEEVCLQHHAEIHAIRESLISDFGSLPLLPTYRQMVIMKTKAGDFALALQWANWGIAVYGDEAGNVENLQDLETRREKLLKKLGGAQSNQGT